MDSRLDHGRFEECEDSRHPAFNTDCNIGERKSRLTPHPPVVFQWLTWAPIVVALPAWFLSAPQFRFAFGILWRRRHRPWPWLFDVVVSESETNPHGFANHELNALSRFHVPDSSRE
jgi:hypothetical protein